jgi:glycosyltransferase involved in cell wall biosynthesis
MAIKILIVSDHYPPFIGGAHRQTKLLAKELIQRGYEVKVATVWHGGFPEQEDDEGVKVIRLKQIRTWPFWTRKDFKQRHQPPFPDPITIIGLRRLINDFKPDILHSYGWVSYSCAVALLGKDIPLLISVRDYGYSCPTRTLVLRGEEVCSGPALSKCISCASLLYGSSKGWVATIGVFLGRGLLKHKIRGMHSISMYVEQVMERDFWRERRSGLNHSLEKVNKAIIPSFQESEEQSLEVDVKTQEFVNRLPNQPFILFVGALRRVKGINQLLEAYQNLNAPPPLVLIGTIESDSPSQFPPGVTVLTNFPHQAVMAAWARCLFGVIPSLWPEPLGSVVYEGMSQGKAIIGTTPGGHTDMIIHNKTGFLVPLGDVAALADAMQRLIAQPELCERLGWAGRERARLFTADVAVPQFERLYTQLANLGVNGEYDLPQTSN